MFAPLIPTPLDHLGHRRFSFYPPIVNVEHNEWVVRRTTWNEVQVMNTKTTRELWIPRRFVGEVSLVEDPVMIVGLLQELEYTGDMVLPYVRRVIEMPRAVNDSFRLPVRAAKPNRPAPVIGIRLESGAESRAGRRMRTFIAAGILACVSAAIVVSTGTRVKVSAPSSIHLPLQASDDYESIVRRFGPPLRDRSFEIGKVQYRRLWYPQRSFALILMGSDRQHLLYIGAIDVYGRVIHSVDLPDGRSSAPLIRKSR